MKPYIICMLLATLWQSCIMEELNNCEEGNYVLTIHVSDIVSGDEITTSGVCGDVIVFFFDSQEYFMDSIRVTASQIKEMTAIPVTLPSDSNLWIVAWGNLNGHQQLSGMDKNCRMSAPVIKLITNTDGYTQYPDDLFFGLHHVALSTRSIENTQLWICRKNARMNISVRGLPANNNPSDYSFRITDAGDGYHLEGQVLSSHCKMKASGQFNPAGLYTTPMPLNMIHSGDESIRVSLYHHDQLLASTAGTPIHLTSGMLTNVLIDITTVQSVISLQVTPYNQIYQWEIW